MHAPSSTSSISYIIPVNEDNLMINAVLDAHAPSCSSTCFCGCVDSYSRATGYEATILAIPTVSTLQALEKECGYFAENGHVQSRELARSRITFRDTIHPSVRVNIVDSTLFSCRLIPPLELTRRQCMHCVVHVAIVVLALRKSLSHVTELCT